MLKVDVDDKSAIGIVDGLSAGLKDMAPFWSDVGIFMERRIARAFQVGGIPKWPVSRRAQNEGGKTLLLSNRLRSSITYDPSAHSVIIGTNTAYARLQNEGGIVKPRKAKALAIPLNKKARKAAEDLPEGASIRDIKGLFFVALKRSGQIGILAKRATMSYNADTGEIKKSKTSMFGEYKTKRGKKKVGLIEPWFAIRTSVKIPARPFLVVNHDDMKKLERMLDRYLNGATRRKTGGTGVS